MVATPRLALRGLLLAICLVARLASAQQGGAANWEPMTTTTVVDDDSGAGTTVDEFLFDDSTDMDGNGGFSGAFDDGSPTGAVGPTTTDLSTGTDPWSGEEGSFDGEEWDMSLSPSAGPDSIPTAGISDDGRTSDPLGDQGIFLPFSSPALAPAPAPAPLPSPPPPPPSPSPPPPPPSGTRVNLVLRLAGATYPMPADMAERVASTVSILTPGHTWTYSEQQPSYPGQTPKVPRVAAAAAQALAPAPAAGSGAALEEEEPGRATVDPLPINGLGRKLRQVLAAVPQLTQSAKDQCFSVKHALAPDEATCLAWCVGQLAEGNVDADEYGPRFYDKKGTMCCGCNKKREKNDDADTGATTPLPAEAPPTAPEEPKVMAEADGGAGMEADTGDDKEGDSSSVTVDKPAKAATPANQAAPAAAPAVAEGWDGVYVFAHTLVMNAAEEEVLNATMYEAAGSRRLMDSLKATAGVSASMAEVVWVGSGEYRFLPPVARYVRPGYVAAPSTPSEAEASSSGNDSTVLIGAVLGSVVAAAIVVAIVVACCVRRRRKHALEGPGLVRKWEYERKQAEEECKRQQEDRRAASQAANERYWSRVQSQQTRSQKLDQLRSKLGLGPRDHLAAAAAKMEAAEVAESAKTVAAPPPPPIVAESSGKSTGSGSKPSTTAPSPAHTITLEAHTPASETLPMTVVVRSQPPLNGGSSGYGGRSGSISAAGPSWATRDPAAEPKPGMFTKWFGKG